MHPLPPQQPARRAWLAWLTYGLLACAALVGGCGGGGDGVGSGGTGSFAVGPVAGYGSIIVNGVRYDDRTATVTDQDGAASNAAAVQLGMVVEIEGSAITGPATDRRATASTIRYGSELLGVVEAVDPAASTLTVFGSVVRVDANTVFDSTLAGGLAALQAGQVVEVYGFLDPAAARYTATRIERKDAGVSRLKLRGVVSGLDTAAQRFRVGNALVSYAGVAGFQVPANGDLVRLRVDPTPVGGVWSLQRLDDGGRRLEDRDEAEIEGLITAFDSATRFSVDGVPVDAGNATVDGDPAALALGARVEVEGRITAGVLVAAKVDIEDQGGGSGSGGGGGGGGGGGDDNSSPIELNGAPSAIDTAAQTLVLRGVRVRYAEAEFRDGTAADLSPDREIRVDGRLDTDGVTVVADRIRFQP